MKKYCKLCGYTTIKETLEKCPICKSTDWEDADLITLKEISNDNDFLEAMIELKKNDPIEYQLKMSQFKTNLGQQESSTKKEESTKDVIRCPKCKSTAITTGARGVNNFWGLLGASKTVNRCGNCGYTWKPNNW